ncbi:Exonuclease 3'-5' domain-containing protein [Thalictrum thalictroides]|uniref:Exonuclease 3'-5' domain-containing protein n=1 Tax=Thalictrum thalictroides TaxID=46969 RepID=A0A7J6W1D7_THATH|nr:Exonuclease 3'-5' domain-containing protein [Thalictrum thalictroides]
MHVQYHEHEHGSDAIRRPWMVSFGGKNIRTTVTNKGETVAKWINDYGQRKYDEGVIVGLDAEGYFTKPKGGTMHWAILQLCIGLDCLVYQIFNTDYIPEEIVEFLADTRNTFVGVAIEDDVRLLKQDYGLTVSNILDLRYLAARKLNSSLYEKSGLKSLAKEFLHVELEKSWQIHRNWRATCLTKAQIEYASRDAAASYYIGLELSLIHAC